MFPLHAVDATQLRNLSARFLTSAAPTYALISRSQYRVFEIAHVVAPFSIFGSLAIIYRIRRIDRFDHDANNKRTYQRLLVSMSICDLFGSMALMFGTTPIPKETLLETARGNRATCTAQGFFIHWFAMAVLYYNTGLMIYFLLTIRYRWTEVRVAKWMEPTIHAWALVVPLGQSVAGLFLQIFNPIGFGNFCYIAPYPLLCGIFTECTRGITAKPLYIYFVIVPVCVLLATIYVSIILIYCAVRHQASRALAITANRDSVRARTKAVAVQSCLFAVVFFFTWVHSVLGPLVLFTAARSQGKVKTIYILSVMTSTFWPLQGFFTFCIYIRPRFLRLWRDKKTPFCAALRLAIFGGLDSSSAQHRQALQHRRSSLQAFGNQLSPTFRAETPTSSSADHSDSVKKAETLDKVVKVEVADVSPNNIREVGEGAARDAHIEAGAEETLGEVAQENTQDNFL